jgi:teichuronic acid exporter
MLDQNLRKKTISGMAWNTLEKFSVYGISLVFGIIFARILMPSDYGLIGMLSIFFAFSDLFVNSGFSSALIQKKDRTQVDYSTIFYFNVLVAIVFYITLYFSAPLISKFYKVPELSTLTRVLSLNIIINSLSLVQQTQLTINLKFKTQAIISLCSVIVSGSIGIFTGYHGFGVWALVVQSVTSAITKASLLFYFNRWKPLLIFSSASFKQLFGFSSKVLGAGIISTFFNNIYSLVIGKTFPTNDLGYYTRGKQYPELISTLITSVFQNVTFPVLASLQDNKEQMISTFRRLIRVVVFFVVPSMTLLAIISGPFIRFLLTEKWAPVIPLMQWMCFARVLYPISALNLTLLNSMGRSDLFFKMDSTKVPIALIILFITIPMGLKAIVIGHLITSVIGFFLNAYYPGKFFGFGVIRQFKEMWLVILATLIMSGVVVVIMVILPTDFLKLIICLPLGMIIYLVSSYLLKIEEINEVSKIINSIFSKKVI